MEERVKPKNKVPQTIESQSMINKGRFKDKTL